jgi:hypothetical protein
MTITLTASSEDVDSLFRLELKGIGYNLKEWKLISVKSFEDRVIALVKKGKHFEIFYRWVDATSNNYGDLWESIEGSYVDIPGKYLSELHDHTPLGKLEIFPTDSKIPSVLATFGISKSHPRFRDAFSQISNFVHYTQNPMNYYGGIVDLISDTLICFNGSVAEPIYKSVKTVMVETVMLVNSMRDSGLRTIDSDSYDLDEDD